MSCSEVLADDAHRLVVDLPLLSAAERREVVFDWNRVGTAYSRATATVDAIFAARLIARLTQLAVVFVDASVTYSELDRRSNQMARDLKIEGVGVETPVASSLTARSRWSSACWLS